MRRAFLTVLMCINASGRMGTESPAVAHIASMWIGTLVTVDEGVRLMQSKRRAFWSANARSRRTIVCATVCATHARMRHCVLSARARTLSALGRLHATERALSRASLQQHHLPIQPHHTTREARPRDATRAENVKFRLFAGAALHSMREDILADLKHCPGFVVFDAFATDPNDGEARGTSTRGSSHGKIKVARKVWPPANLRGR